MLRSVQAVHGEVLVLTIITSIYGDYDTLQPALPAKGLRWILVTDKVPEDTKGWEVVERSGTTDGPLLDAKYAKFHPWEFTDDETVIWIDGSLSLATPRSAWDLAMRAHPIAQFTHPDRDCIYDEGKFSLTMPRYAGMPIDLQLESYARNHPCNWGLWACGMFAARKAPTRELLIDWSNEVNQWTPQDQISYPVALRRAKLRPVSLLGSIYSNRWTRWHGHKPPVPKAPPEDRWAAEDAEAESE